MLMFFRHAYKVSVLFWPNQKKIFREIHSPSYINVVLRLFLYQNQQRYRHHCAGGEGLSHKKEKTNVGICDVKKIECPN